MRYERISSEELLFPWVKKIWPECLWQTHLGLDREVCNMYKAVRILGVSHYCSEAHKAILDEFRLQVFCDIVASRREML